MTKHRANDRGKFVRGCSEGALSMGPKHIGLFLYGLLLAAIGPDGKGMAFCEAENDGRRTAYRYAWPVWTGRFAASHPTMPPAISLTRENPRLCNKLAAMDDRYPPAQ